MSKKKLKKPAKKAPKAKGELSEKDTDQVTGGALTPLQINEFPPGPCLPVSIGSKNESGLNHNQSLLRA